MGKRFKYQDLRELCRDHRATFDFLLITDDNFTEACENYEECRLALEDPMMDDGEHELRDLCEELRKEILDYVKRFWFGGTDADEEHSLTVS